MAETKLNQPVQSIVPDPDGEGYWLVASDGGVFAFKAPFRGSTGSMTFNKPMTGMVPFGNGYLMVAEDGGVFNYSDRPFSGSLGSNPPVNPVVSITALSCPRKRAVATVRKTPNERARAWRRGSLLFCNGQPFPTDQMPLLSAIRIKSQEPSGKKEPPSRLS
ncbi:MAG: hypothetical protein ACRDV9_14155 [Acidimicrobiia bacterium]